jgi:hypothetical protein
MRELIINRLKAMIEVAPDYGIPRYFDCDEEEYITDVEDLSSMDDEALLEVFEACVGFGG